MWEVKCEVLQATQGNRQSLSCLGVMLCALFQHPSACQGQHVAQCKLHPSDTAGVFQQSAPQVCR